MSNFCTFKREGSAPQSSPKNLSNRHPGEIPFDFLRTWRHLELGIQPFRPLI